MAKPSHLTVTVVGAGPGALATAAHLVQLGCWVRILNRGRERIESVLRHGGVSTSGIMSGFARVDAVTTVPEEAIAGTRLILVVTPANAHADIAAMLAPHLENGQIVVLTPGRTGGALEFSAILRRSNTKADVIIGETQTILYTCRAATDVDVHMVALKKRNCFSAFPAVRTAEVSSLLTGICKQYVAVADVLETSLNNVGCILHPAPTLLNMGGIENPRFRFTYYYEGITPSIAHLLELLDEERLSVARCLGVKGVPIRDWLHETYGSSGADLYEAIHNTEAYETIEAPDTIQHRYLLEDVPTGLVPISSLAHRFGVDVPITDRVIDLASLVCKTDFRKTGRTVTSLQIDHLSVQQVRDYVQNGR